MPPNGKRGSERDEIVDEAASRIDALRCDRLGALDIAREDRGAEPITRVVRKPHSRLGIIRGHDRCDRSEHLLDRTTPCPASRA